MLTCPQCRKPIEGMAHETYAIGWCRQDIHLDCFPLHSRSCAACRQHNIELILADTETRLVLAQKS
jgi:hypothetical protein